MLSQYSVINPNRGAWYFKVNSLSFELFILIANV